MAGPFFRHGSNALIVAGIAVLAAGGVGGIWRASGAAIALGTLLFFLSEYGTHRFVLHAPPAPGPFLRRLQHRLHYDHHLEPARLDLLFLPPWFLVPALAVFALVYAAIARDASVVGSLVLGNLIGLLFYEWVHYVAHVPIVPVTPFGRWIKKYHLRHHFRNEKRGFGVTNPLFDVLSRTYEPASASGRSETTRTLFR